MTLTFTIFVLDDLYAAVEESTQRAIDDKVFYTLEDAQMHVLLHGQLDRIVDVAAKDLAGQHVRNMDYAVGLIGAHKAVRV